MPTAVATAESIPSPGETARVWALHCLSFVLPVTCLVYLLGGLHAGWRAGAVAPRPDRLGRHRHVEPRGRSAARGHAAGLALRRGPLRAGGAPSGDPRAARPHVALHGFWTWDTFVALTLVGVNSGYSGIVVAHELIHRSQAHLHLIGRVLLGSVLYEHFSTEHLRGHHVRVGTAEDRPRPASASPPRAFFLRTVPAQFRSAWRLECKRLGDPAMRWWDRRMLRHRVVHGLVLEWTMAAAILVALGPGAFAAYLVQAAVAVRLLEAVNYFEHWGLTRRNRRITTMDSWDTASRFTLYTLVGLSRHADHHAVASRPYQQLRYFEESPKLPYGYFGTVVFLLARNGRFQEVMTAELQRCRLGPFARADAG